MLHGPFGGPSQNQVPADAMDGIACTYYARKKTDINY